MCFLIFAINLFAAQLSNQSVGQQFHTIGLETDKNICLFNSTLPGGENATPIFSIKGERGGLSGNRLRALTSHPSGGVEILNWERNGQDIHLKHLSVHGQLISTFHILNFQDEELEKNSKIVIGACSSASKEHIAIVYKEYHKRKEPILSIRVCKLSQSGTVIDGECEEFECLYNSLDYQYPQLAWDKDSSSLLYTDSSMNVTLYSTVERKHFKIVNGQFLNTIARSGQLLIRLKDGELCICALTGDSCKYIQIPQKLEKKQILSLHPLPGGQEVLITTPRFLPLVEDALTYWIASIGGTNLRKIGEGRGYIGSIRFTY